MEFVVTVIALLVGFVIAKYASIGLAKTGIPIASGDPIPKSLPGSVAVPWRSK
jgi:hypothetical protein